MYLNAKSCWNLRNINQSKRRSNKRESLRLSSFRKGHSKTTPLLGTRDDIRKAMDKGEVTLMVMADFSKAFDTICFRTTLLKLHKLGFTEPSLKWLLSYLCARRQFVQIDDKSSSCQTIAFEIPQGSILGPMIFNLYVSNLKDVIPASTKCSQYADDTTLYHHTPMQDLAGGVSLMNNALSELHSWSKESNLALNPDKTKSMLFSTRQMFTRRNLSSFPLLLSVGGKDLERVKNTKLLGVHLDENLLWDEHVKNLASSCYTTLASLRKIKHFTPCKLRKHLAESLILSRLDYCDIVMFPLPQHLLKRLQRIQFSAASFATGRYVNSFESLLKLGWLPVRERRDWHLLKTAHKALYSHNWPQTLRLEKVKHTRLLRSNSTVNLVVPRVSNTFQDTAARIFNTLPSGTKSCVDSKSFSKQAFTFLKSRLS